MQTPDLTLLSSYRPDHLSLADPVKEWLDHPHRRPFASSCGLEPAPILPRMETWDWASTSLVLVGGSTGGG